MPRSKPTALRSTFRIESDDPESLALALKQRIGTISGLATGQGGAGSPLTHVCCGSVTIETDRPNTDLIAATRAAMRAAGIETATVWTGSSGVEVAAAMDDARLSAAAIMLAALATTPSSTGELRGVPLS